MRYLIIAVLLVIQITSFAQESNETTSESKIRIIQDERMQMLESNYKKIRRQTARPSSQIRVSQTVRGYRVQIYSGNDRAKATDVRIKFMGSYPNTPCYLQFLSPYYKVRVGDYSSSQEAAKQLKYFQRVYPSALVVPSYINQ